jgi:hypothetical protein
LLVGQPVAARATPLPLPEQTSPAPLGRALLQGGSTAGGGSGGRGQDADADADGGEGGGQQSQSQNYAGGHWKLTEKHYFNQRGAKLCAAAFHGAAGLVAVGFSAGIFELLQLPDLQPLHTLSVGREKLTALAFSPAGDWVAVRLLAPSLLWVCLVLQCDDGTVTEQCPSARLRAQVFPLHFQGGSGPVWLAVALCWEAFY